MFNSGPSLRQAQMGSGSEPLYAPRDINGNLAPKYFQGFGTKSNHGLRGPGRLQLMKSNQVIWRKQRVTVWVAGSDARAVKMTSVPQGLV